MRSWPRGRTLAIGTTLIVLTNAAALGGVWWNRSAIPESALTLSERELRLPWRSLRFTEDSGLALNLNWRVAEREAGESGSGPTFNGGAPEWLAAAQMTALGFASGDLDSDAGRRRYTRQLPREAILVLELDGPARQYALDRARANAAQHAARNTRTAAFLWSMPGSMPTCCARSIPTAAASSCCAGQCGPPCAIADRRRKRPATSRASAPAGYMFRMP